jgi:histidinol phosphatase-like PHP family hydrolase
MKFILPAAFCFAALCGLCWADGQYALSEMDMHLHAGLERRVPLDEWLDLAVAGGRKEVVLLDHLELYAQSQAERESWIKKDKLPNWYPIGAEGHKAIMADFERAKARKDLVVFRGWEVAEFDLDDGIEEAPLKMAEVIGWHISPNKSGNPPDGKLLLRRIRQIKQVQKKFAVPMILFHPFPMRLERLLDNGAKPGNPAAGDLRFFHGNEQEEVIRELKGQSIYIEMSKATEAFWKNDDARAALIADIKPLADAGVKFTVSTDAHSVADIKAPFHPETYCEPCGITAENANALVTDLLQRRATRDAAKKDK